jgi:hypothetical protein
MRKAILGAASALALASPAVAADLPVTPRYSEVPSYEREAQPYQYRPAPPVVVEEPTVVVRRPVIIARRPVLVDEYHTLRGICCQSRWPMMAAATKASTRSAARSLRISMVVSGERHQR